MAVAIDDRLVLDVVVSGTPRWSRPTLLVVELAVTVVMMRLGSPGSAPVDGRDST
jgi:hypothetical protein